MAAMIPDNPVTQQDLITWYNMKVELARLRTAEMLLRRKIFNAYFPDPKEGTNSFTMPDGAVMKGVQGIDRQIDEGAALAMKDELAEANISLDKLIRRKPELVVKEYRLLTQEQMNLFDQCLVIKPESPSLEIVVPKKKKDK